MVAMLARLTVRNFKRFEEVEIELGNPVVGRRKDDPQMCQIDRRPVHDPGSAIYNGAIHRHLRVRP